ncbi:MAG: acetolactate decarboxylase [Rhodoglobus sp.]|nr:acetolactate decarboxylase [Rhodoglobus sp.]
MTRDLRPRPGTAIHQFSFVDALVAGLYEGAFAASDVLGQSDHGLGCGEALDGEIVVLDGTAFVCRDDGTVQRLDASAPIPFAEMVRFEPTHVERIEDMDARALELRIDELVPSRNLFYAVRVDGAFDRMTVREAARQQQPYRGLAQAVADQHEDSASSTVGSVFGFRGPEVFQGLSVADWHLHYLDDERTLGGHVMNFRLRSGSLAIQALSEFTVHLPEVDSYLDAALDHHDSDAAIRQAEGS